MIGLLIFWATYYYDQKKNLLNFIDMMLCPIGLYVVLSYNIYQYNTYGRIFLGLWLIRMLHYHWYFLNKYPKYYSGYLVWRLIN